MKHISWYTVNTKQTITRWHDMIHVITTTMHYLKICIPFNITNCSMWCLLAIYVSLLMLVNYSCNCRVKLYISNGWAIKYLVVASSDSADHSITGEWTNIKACLFSTSTSPIFSSLAYFVSHTATDGPPAEYIKSIRQQNIHMTVGMYKMKLVIQIR